MKTASDTADTGGERPRRKRTLSAGVIWFLVCLLYAAPAALMASLLRTAVPQLQLHNVSGGFWRGGAAQAFWLQNEGQQVIALGRLDWHLQPQSLLWLQPSAHITASYGEQFFDAHVRVSPFGNLTLTQTSAALPAALLSSWVPVPARGQVALTLERAELSHAQIGALRGTLYWQQAQWQWNSHWLALGDYRCELTVPAAQQIRCALQGRGGVAVDGAVDVDTHARNWSAQLQMHVETSLPDDFRQALQLMLAVQPDAQGGFSVRRSGHW